MGCPDIRRGGAVGIRGLPVVRRGLRAAGVVRVPHRPGAGGTGRVCAAVLLQPQLVGLGGASGGRCPVRGALAAATGPVGLLWLLRGPSGDSCGLR